jgi:serine/threonine protein kinase
MPPEQVRGKELDTRTDLFSFGTVLYEMATGILPFRGDTSGLIFESILNRVPMQAVRMNPEIPTKLEEIINKALEKNREIRCQSAAELRADLKRLKRDTKSGKMAVRERVINLCSLLCAESRQRKVTWPSAKRPNDDWRWLREGCSGPDTGARMSSGNIHDCSNASVNVTVAKSLLQRCERRLPCTVTNRDVI